MFSQGKIRKDLVMKKTLFSKGLYVEGLRKLRVLGFIALALMIVIQIVMKK